MNLPAGDPASAAKTAAGCQTPGLPADKTQLQRLPKWLKRQLPKGNANHFTAGLLDELRLETVCDNARCPNR
ncbi:MAG: hypothetical protein ACK53V_22350, partial [Planctomycetota bacterium]